MSDADRAAPEAGAVLTLAKVASVVRGTLWGAGSAEVLAYAIDSRAVRPGALFFALEGARVDGHDFLADARKRGAVGAIVRRNANVPRGLVHVRVGDTAEALARVGAHFREAWPLRVVGITGSAGKTTTKEFTAALLSRSLRVFRSEGNLNSTIGLPLTLTRRRPEDEVAVLELAMSTPGELRRVAAIARPDVAVVTNVGLAHVGNFTSADDIAREKAQILEGVRPGGAFVANADDARVMAMARGFTGTVVTFGTAPEADVRAESIEPLGAEGTRFTLVAGGRSVAARVPLPGAHHVSNALAALAAARALGLDPHDLAPDLEELAAAEHRGRLVRLAGDVLLLDDCYNANPAALAHALDALRTLPGSRRVAVVGDMRELGAWSEVAHREAGRHAAVRADVVVAVGQESAVLAEEARATGCREVHHLPDAAAAAEAVPALVHDGDAVLVKASRGIGLELVVEALRKARG